MIILQILEYYWIEKINIWFQVALTKYKYSWTTQETEVKIPTESTEISQE